MLHKTLSSLSWLFRIWWNLWIKWYVQFFFFTFTHAFTGLLNSWFMILDNTEKHQMHCWYFSLRLVRHIISVGTQEPFLSINWFALHLMHLADKSHLQCIQAIYIYYQYVCSLGIEPMTFCVADAMLYHWATGTGTETLSLIFMMFH